MATGTYAAAPASEPGRAVRPARLSDELLARYAARGSARAFTAIYDRYHQQLYAYCRSILRNDADAQDALQATFAGALSALRRNQRHTPLRPWMFRIAHNEAVSILRRRQREREREHPIAAPAPTPEDRALERARWETLMSDVRGLPERQRGALLLRELSGLSHEEIATALQTTVGGAKQAIFEARQALSELEQGRAMSCEDIRRRLSDGDRRVVRGRRVRAHLRECSGCAAFAGAMSTRRAELRAFMPALPPALAAVVLSRSIHAASLHGSGGGGAAGAAIGGGASAPGVAGGGTATGTAASAATTGAAGGAVSVGSAAAGTALATKALAGVVLVAVTAAGATGLTHVLQNHHASPARSPAHGARSAPAAVGGSAGNPSAGATAAAAASHPAQVSKASPGARGAHTTAGVAGRRGTTGAAAAPGSMAGRHAGQGLASSRGKASADAGRQHGSPPARQVPGSSASRPDPSSGQGAPTGSGSGSQGSAGAHGGGGNGSGPPVSLPGGPPGGGRPTALPRAHG